MDTNAVTPNHSFFHPLPELATAALANTVGSMTATLTRLERIRADQELILAPVEPEEPAWGAAPTVAVGTPVLVGAVPLPSQGWAEPASQTGLGTTGADEVATEAAESASPGDAAGDAAAATPQGLTAFTSSTVTKRELAFLDDKSLSIEEKLFRFMALMTKKADQDLVAYMKEIGGKKSTTSSSSGTSGSSGTDSSSGTTGSTGSSGSSGSSGSTGSTGSTDSDPAGEAPTSDAGDDVNPAYRDLLDGMSPDEIHEKYGYGAQQMINLMQRGDPDASPGFLSAAERVGVAAVHGAAWAAHEFAGPALAAGVTALGVPELAPLAKMVGSELGDLLADGLDSLADGDDEGGPAATASTDAAGSDASSAGTGSATVASTSTSSSSSSSSAPATAVDERLQVANLERLVQKQTAMFATLSNVLKSLHDTQMSAIQNLR